VVALHGATRAANESPTLIPDRWTDKYTMRTCPSCGQTKDDSGFYYGARRCRKCVAKDRSTRARQERDRIQQGFGTVTSVSGRRVRNLGKSATQEADTRIPVTARHRVGTAMLGLVVLSLFGGLILAEESFFFWVLGLIIAALAAWGGSKLTGPRDTAVSTLSAAILSESVHRVDRQQQEYERFYLTADWRELRMRVIARDGNLCSCCNQPIQYANDVTVDHIKPRSRYPELALALSNLQVLCRRCNSSKGAR